MTIMFGLAPDGAAGRGGGVGCACATAAPPETEAASAVPASSIRRRLRAPSPLSISPRSSGEICLLMVCPFPDDAAEADVARRRIHRLRMARGGAVAAAVARRAQVRAALDHLARDPDLRLARVVATGLAPTARVLRDAAGLRRVGFVPGCEPVRRPLPDVADHVVEA